MIDVKKNKKLNMHATAADLLVSYLNALNIEYVFGIPGGAIEPLYDALARSQRLGGPRQVLARHETGAAFMADGYARNSGKLGVCCATTGPGVTNLITGVASAYQNRVPLLVITGQTPLANFGRLAFQESSDTGIDTIGMLRFCTGYNSLVSHVNQLERKLLSALASAIQNKSPSHLGIPHTILAAPLRPTPGYKIDNFLSPHKAVDPASVVEVSKRLNRAEKVVLVVGADCEHAEGSVLTLAAKLNAWVVTTPDGKGLISAQHPANRGVIGFAGHETAHRTLTDPSVDVVVALGVTYSEWGSNGWDANALLNTRLINIAARNLDRSHAPMASLNVFGDLRTLLSMLASKAVKRPARDARQYPKGAHFAPPDEAAALAPQSASESAATQRIKPQQLMAELPGCLPETTRYLADTGNSLAWAVHFLSPRDRRTGESGSDPNGETSINTSVERRKSRGGTLQVTIEFAAMGWAISAAVGAAMARPGQPVVCITGDGSWLMNGQEITVAKEHGLAIVFIVLNDGALGMVKHGQRLTGAESVGWQLPEVDFSMMARAVGVPGNKIATERCWSQLKADDSWLQNGPVLLDVHIDQSAMPPLSLRTSLLQLSRQSSQPVGDCFAKPLSQEFDPT